MVAPSRSPKVPNMDESTSTPGLCARCGADPAENGVRLGTDWYCNTGVQPCFSKYINTRRALVTPTTWSPLIRALLGERPE